MDATRLEIHHRKLQPFESRNFCTFIEGHRLHLRRFESSDFDVERQSKARILCCEA